MVRVSFFSACALITHVCNTLQSEEVFPFSTGGSESHDNLASPTTSRGSLTVESTPSGFAIKVFFFSEEEEEEEAYLRSFADPEGLLLTLRAERETTPRRRRLLRMIETLLDSTRETRSRYSLARPTRSMNMKHSERKGKRKCKRERSERKREGKRERNRERERQCQRSERKGMRSERKGKRERSERERKRQCQRQREGKRERKPSELKGKRKCKRGRSERERKCKRKRERSSVRASVRASVSASVSARASASASASASAGASATRAPVGGEHRAGAAGPRRLLQTAQLRRVRPLYITF
jgi:hypothetical protein